VVVVPVVVVPVVVVPVVVVPVVRVVVVVWVVVGQSACEFTPMMSPCARCAGTAAGATRMKT
jgi:hypothetical protein